MRRINFKLIAVTVIICLLPILLGLSFYNELPDKVAIHFDINNNPDNFASKGFFVLGLPVIMALFQAVCCVVYDIKISERNIKLAQIFKWIVPFVTVFVYALTLAYALVGNIDIRKYAMLIVGVVFVITGNYLPKYYRLPGVNGIRSKNEVIEAKLNRGFGYTLIAGGVLCAASVFLPPVASIIAVSLVAFAGFVLQIIGWTAK